MPSFITDSIVSEIGVLRIKLGRTQSYLEKKQLQVQIADKQQFLEECIRDRDYVSSLTSLYPQG